MKIRQLQADRKRDVEQFSRFPFELYQNCSFWVPPLSSELKLVFDRKRFPFYRHSEADFFVAESEGQTLGRIAVLHHRNYSAYHGQETAFFYYFDVVEDLDAARGLFQAAFDWAKNRNIQTILGPKGFLRSSGLGALVEGFDHLPAVGIAYNYPYYDAFIKDSGFEKLTDYLSGYMAGSHQLPERVREVAEKVKERNHFWIKTFSSKQEIKTWIPKVEEVHQQAFAHNPGFTPSTSEEFDLLANNIIQIADPHLIKLIMKDDQVAGFMIIYANISTALQKSRGDIWPFGWLYLLKAMRDPKAVDINGLGLLPAYQGLGCNALLYTEVENTLRAANVDQVEIVQVDEANFKSRSDMETMGVTWYKRHRTYQKTL